MQLKPSHVLASVAVFAAIWLFWPSAPTSKSQSAPPSSEPVVLEIASDTPLTAAPHSPAPTEVGPLAQQGNASVPPAELPEMPAPDLPFAQAKAALKERAEAGDTTAAMRLVDEARCCAGWNDGLRNMLDRQVMQLEPNETAVFENWRATLKAHASVMSARCGERSQDLANLRPIEELARKAGDPQSVIEFAKSRPSYGLSIRQQIELLQERENDALLSLHRLVAGGNLDAVMLLASLYATPSYHGDLGQLVQQDWQTTATYNFLYLRAGGTAYRTRVEGFANQMTTRLSAAQLETAKADAEVLYQASFAGRKGTEYGIALAAPGLQKEPTFVATPRYPGASACPVAPKANPDDLKVLMQVFTKMRGGAPPLVPN